MRKKNKYDTRGFNITDYYGDNEFNIKTLETSLSPDLLNIHAKNEHFRIIEWSICKIKELARAKCHAIPFKRYKSKTKRSLKEVLVDLLKRFPSKDGVSDTLISSKIVEGRPKVDMGQKSIAFGPYAMFTLVQPTKWKPDAFQRLHLKRQMILVGIILWIHLLGNECIDIIGKSCQSYRK